MKVQSRGFRTHRVIGKYVAVIALMASGLTVGLAGVAAADTVSSASTVVASAPVVAADGTTTTTITVTLAGGNGATDTVKLAGVNANSSVINTGAAGASVTEAASGNVAAFTVSDTVGEAVTYQATDVTDANEVVALTATVTFEGAVILTPVAGSFASTTGTPLTTVSPTLANAGDVLVIWTEDTNVGTPGTPPGAHVTAIAKASGTGAIGTPVETIDRVGIQIPSDFEIWYVPVTAAGSIVLNVTWSRTLTASDEIEYSTQEFQPASPATYSTGPAGASETTPASTTLTYPTLTATAGELYAGFNIFVAANNTPPTGTTTGYAAEVAAMYDVILINPGTSAGSQSPTTTTDSANSSIQSAIAALISARSCCTVNFNNSGGTGSLATESATVATNLSAFSTGTMAKPGYTFAGWNTDANGSGNPYANGASYPFTSSATLYAQWTANATDTITFNSQGGTAEANMTGPNGSAITLPTPTQAGYVFNGWFTAATGGTHETSPYTLTGSLPLFAQWTANATDTITFNSQGGTTEANMTGPNGSAITLPTPTQAGYVFNGWFTAATGGTHETSPYTLTGSLPLFAQWTSNGGGGGGGGGTGITLTVTATGGSAKYGTVFTPASTVSAGLATGDTATVSTATYTYAGTGSTTYASSTTAPTALGTYSVTPSAATVAITPSTDASNYSTTYTYVAGALTITAGTLTVTVGNLSITAGGTVTPTATVSGVGGSDAATVSSATYTYAGTGSTTYAASATAPTAAGTYSITPSAATLAVTPTADAVDYSTTYTYVSGTLTIQAKAKPPIVFHASRIIGSILPGRRLSIAFIGSGFSGQPKITGTTKGIKISVSKDTGTRLTAWVTVPKGTRAGHGTFTIRLSSGKICKINYTIK